MLRRNRDQTSSPVSSVRCSITHRRRTIGRPDPRFCFAAPPGLELWGPDARSTSAPTGPRAQLRLPPPDFVANHPARPLCSIMSLGEHHRDLPVLLRQLFLAVAHPRCPGIARRRSHRRARLRSAMADTLQRRAATHKPRNSSTLLRRCSASPLQPFSCTGAARTPHTGEPRRPEPPPPLHAQLRAPPCPARGPGESRMKR